MNAATEHPADALAARVLGEVARLRVCPECKGRGWRNSAIVGVLPCATCAGEGIVKVATQGETNGKR